MKLPALFLSLGLVICFASHGQTISAKAEITSHPLVTSINGDMPIILSAPHGGREAVPEVPPRQGKGVEFFKSQADSHTAQLTEELADAIAQQTGKRPYVVIARFHRKFIDANRAPEGAYESDQAKPVYDAYHAALAAARKEMMARWGSGIVLDLHGQATALTTIFRGTRDGKTTTHLTKHFGRESLIGEKSLFGNLARQGFNVQPPIDSEKPEEQYNGGHIVVTYGSASGGTIDAIQLELGTHLRSTEQRTKTAEKMARAIAAFANEFLPKKEIFPNSKNAAQPLK